MAKGKPRGPLTEEHKANLSAAHTGTHQSEETKVKIGVASMGNKYAYIEDRTHTSDTNPYPSSFRDANNVVRELLGDSCEECGKTPAENNRQMDKHHIDEDKENNGIENFRLMCQSCHAKLHAQLRKNTVRI